MYWQLNRIIYPVYNLGPGRRLAIWVQGCGLACPGCINPELWDATGGRKVEVFGLAQMIKEVAPHFDGITITGGEPFDQYEALMVFARFIKQETRLDTLVFSGYTLAGLLAKFPDKLFTHAIHYLIDGPYRKELHADDQLRGSSNQQLYRFGQANADRKMDDFGDIKIEHVDFWEATGSWALKIDENKQAFMSGIPRRNDMDHLARRLNDSGIKFTMNNV
jgi:anaerobic ribonucleoside-triphosphate reductase activating protein